MPRPERALDVTAGPLPRFAADLRELRRAAGGMPYREMSRIANYSATVLSDAAAGRRLPTLAVTLAYVAACGGDEDEWRARWQALAAEVATEAGSSGETGARTTDVTAPAPARRSRTVRWLAAAVVTLLATTAFLAILLLRKPAVPVPSGGVVMPEHMLPFNAEGTEAEPVSGEPPSGLTCSTLPQATACLDLAHDLVWVKDLPPGDGHHPAGYWSTTDGAAHGECHNYLATEGPWATCPLPDLPDGARLGLRTANVEKSTVLTWGPYEVVATDGTR